MTIIDIRILEAITKLHEAARVVEQDINIGDVSRSIRKAADQLTTLIQEKENGTN